MSYREFLTWLLSLGPKLPEIMASIQRIVAEIQIIRGLIGAPELFTAAEASAEEAALEQQVLAAATPDTGGAEAFGGPFKTLLDFIRNNKELIALLISLFGKK